MATAFAPKPIHLTGGPSKPSNGNPKDQVPALYGNDGELQDVHLLTPCTPDTTIEEMRRKYREDGVLWVCQNGVNLASISTMSGPGKVGGKLLIASVEHRLKVFWTRI